jgi:transposase
LFGKKIEGAQERMLAMAKVNYIKHLRDVEDKSILQIVNQVGVNWRTAKKYADCLDWNKENKPIKERKFPIMDPYREIVDTWLLEDKNRPKKQRHTAKRVYDRLMEEFGFKGSERTIRYYVAKRKKEFDLEKVDSHNRLEHPGGEAQVDFGDFQAVIDGKIVERKMLILSYPCSNIAFTFITPRENMECFLEGLKSLFERSGGVPTKIWFDNLSAAVVTVLKGGERIVTDDFNRFALHYRFNPSLIIYLV